MILDRPLSAGALETAASAAAATLCEHSEQVPKEPDSLEDLRSSHLRASVAEADQASQRSLPAAVKPAAGLVAEVVEGEAGACRGSGAEAFEKQVTLAASDVVEALSCVLARGSWFGWAGSEGRSWAGWKWWTGAGW